MEISKKKKLSLVNTSYSDLKWMITIIEWVRTDKTCCGCLSPSELRTSFWYQGIILSGLFVVQLKCSRNENLANMQQFCRMYGRIDLLHSRGIRNFRKNGNAILPKSWRVQLFFLKKKTNSHLVFVGYLGHLASTLLKYVAPTDWRWSAFWNRQFLPLTRVCYSQTMMFCSLLVAECNWSRRTPLRLFIG